MSTEELVQALKNFKDNFPISEKDKALITIDEQIKELQSKLDNKESYRAGEVEQSASVNPENEIMRNGFEVRENRVAENTTRLDELGFALEEAEQALVDKRREFSNTDYDNIDMNSPEYQGQQALLTALQDQISEIRNEIAECEDSIARDKSVLEDPKYGKAVFEARMAEDPTLNYRQVFEDERTIEDLQAQYQAEQAVQDYTQAEMTEPIDKWINQIQSGEYDAESLSAEMDEFLKNPYLATITDNRDAEIADIDRQLPEIEMGIDAIKQRQLNKLNYAVSTFEAGSETMGINGTYDQKIARTQKNRDAVTAERDQKKAELDALYNELVAHPERSVEIKIRIREAREAMASLANANKETVAKYDERLEKLKFEKEHVLSYEQIERMKELRNELAETDSKTSAKRILEIATELKAIEDTTTLDVNSIRLDERRLAELLSTKAALENRKELLSKDLNVELLTIQQGIGNSLTQSAPAAEETPAVEQAPVTDTNPSLNDLMGNAQVSDAQPTLESLMGDAQVSDAQPTLESLMGNAQVSSPLTDEERKANLKKALENDTMKDSWLQRAENEDVYWIGDEEEISPDQKSKNKFKVAAFAAAGAALKEKAKGMLDKAKAKLSGVKDHFKKHWKKYAVGALVLLISSCAVKNIVNNNGDEVADEQTIDNPEQTPEETPVTPEEVAEAEVPEEDEKEDEQTNTDDNNDLENTNDTVTPASTEPQTPEPIIGTAISTDPSSDIADIVIPIPGELDNSTNIISQTSEIISDNPEQHVISETVTTTGGEVISTKTEEENHEVTVNENGEVTENTTNTNNSSDTTNNGGVQSVTEEVISDDVVLPDIGDNTTDIGNNVVEPDLGGGEIADNENTNTQPEVTNGFGTFSLGANETYVAPMSEAYTQNAQLASGAEYEMTANEDGTFSVTNTGDTDIDVIGQQREESATIDNSDIADELAALGAELGIDLSVEAPTTGGQTR